MVCPHCRQAGTLNNHGRLKNYADQVRGIRFWCCPRRKSRPGCGKSHCIWLKQIIPGQQCTGTNAGELSALLVRTPRRCPGCMAARKDRLFHRERLSMGQALCVFVIARGLRISVSRSRRSFESWTFERTLRVDWKTRTEWKIINITA